MMAKTFSRVLLVTANVGSIFEEPEKMIPVWVQQFTAVVTKVDPEFLAIHCQEVGGKNYEESMQHVNKFIKLLLSIDEMQQFDRARVFLDEDFTAVEKFTALGSLYFIHSSVTAVEIFDFHDAKFVSVDGKEVLSGNIEHVRIKEKAKFAQEFFPDFVWSRKGFIRTRWNLYGTVIDLINIHLIHDVSNISAMETSPSTYSDFRVRALLHTINRFETDHYDKVPFFMFGDYNFRLDTHHLVKHLTVDSVEQKVAGKKNDISKVIYKERENGKVLLTVGKKDFHHHDHNQFFSRTNAMKLRKYDTEPEACRSKLFEYQVTFPPSEDTEDGTSYMPTRCPGWCDRIMMSHDALNLLHSDNGFQSEYKMIGMQICMGDHKPIYLDLQLRHKVNQSNVTGNDNAQTNAAEVVTAVSVSPLMTGINQGGISSGDKLEHGHAPLRKVISVNGEQVDVDSANIHDFTTFEKEELIGTAFMERIKRKSSEVSPVGHVGPAPKRGVSFKNAVKSVMHSEAVMRALRHYAHRSDSEDTEDDDDTVEPKSKPSIDESPEEVTCSSGVSVGDEPVIANCDTTAEHVDVIVDSEVVHNGNEAPAPVDVESSTTNGEVGSAPASSVNGALQRHEDVIVDGIESKQIEADVIFQAAPDGCKQQLLSEPVSSPAGVVATPDSGTELPVASLPNNIDQNSHSDSSHRDAVLPQSNVVISSNLENSSGKDGDSKATESDNVVVVANVSLPSGDDSSATEPNSSVLSSSPKRKDETAEPEVPLSSRSSQPVTFVPLSTLLASQQQKIAEDPSSEVRSIPPDNQTQDSTITPSAIELSECTRDESVVDDNRMNLLQEIGGNADEPVAGEGNGPTGDGKPNDAEQFHSVDDTETCSPTDALLPTSTSTPENRKPATDASDVAGCRCCRIQ